MKIHCCSSMRSGERRSYLWLVSQRSIYSYELPPRAELKRPTCRVYELLTGARVSGVRRLPQFIAHAKALSRVTARPGGQPSGKRLVVVPGRAILSAFRRAAWPRKIRSDRPEIMGP